MGRKVSPEYTNPIDHILLTFVETTNPLFHKLKFTPNMLTTLSLFFELLFIYYYYHQDYTKSAISFGLGYLFDCYDGNYARTYNMQSDFGDKYDHFTDIFTIIALLFLVLTNKNIKRETKIVFMIINSVLAIISYYNLSCQDVYCDEDSNCETSMFFIKFCNNPKNMRYTKYFDCGSLILFNTILIALTNYL